jgi:hypothetical protein
MDIEKLWESLPEIEFITLEQAFALYADAEANNLKVEFINTINAESKKISVALRMGAIIALIKLPVDTSGTQEQESMWLLYSRKVKALTEREFDEFFETQKDLALTQIYYSKVVDTNRVFTIRDEFGNTYTKNERELEHFINIEEPRSYDWTPFVCTEDMEEMAEGLSEFTDYTLVK